MDNKDNSKRPARERQRFQAMYDMLAERSDGVAAKVQHVLPIWPEDMRAMPNHMVRSSIFTTRSGRMPRMHYKSEPVVHLHSNVSGVYTGEELRMVDDELIFLQLLQEARRAELGKPVPFVMARMVEDVGWKANKENYERVRSCLTRLKANELRFDSGGVKGVAVSLIANYEYRLDTPTEHKTARYLVYIDPNIVQLFGSTQFTHLPWEKYKELTPIARKLYAYAASHRVPFPLSEIAFQAICGSVTQSAGKWRQQVKKAGIELVGAGLVTDVWQTKGLIHFTR